ncbi:MAG: hypothetical protein K8S97_00535 [Anaerolineae bacterium]|nr:hypothetical protein [Anaerolineae bacterium]
MTGLDDDLRRMPPQMRAILRYLLNAADGATRQEILEHFGFTARLIDQIIRRLVTPEFIVMEDERVYYLTQKGVDVASLFDTVEFEGPLLDNLGDDASD